MEEYNKMEENTTTASRGNFYYGSSPVSSSVYGRTTTTPVPAGLSQVQISNFHLQQPNESCYEQQSDGQVPVPVQVQVQVHPTVKTEAGGSSSLKFHYPSIIRSLHSFQDHHLQHQEESGGSFGEVEAIKAKIIAHPQYSNILEAYMDCQKVGAPPEVVAKLTAVRKEFEAKQRASVAVAGRDARTKDPELDQFMEAYYDMLVKYSEQLTKTLQEATDFARKVEEQLNTLSIVSLKILNPVWN